MREEVPPSGLPAGSPEEALDCAGDLCLNALAPIIRVPAGIVVLVGPPASGKTAFVRALIARRRIEAEAVVSSDEIRAELFGTAPAQAESDAADARIFEERDRRIVARLATGRTAVAESTNVTPQARARLIAIARRFDAPVTMLRFDPDVTDLLHQHTERGRTDLTAADVRAYAATMARHAGSDQLRSEGASAVHDVPGRRQATTPAEAAARFSFT
ncbi:ATP-binding protein [Streptomyces sp. NPDC126503]|uniref:ATP-binding protein n=1 Tax=Streptomyces sp. NPDC126503 TaxID=3155315 RepID=UPI00332EA0BB